MRLTLLPRWEWGLLDDGTAPPSKRLFSLVAMRQEPAEQHPPVYPFRQAEVTEDIETQDYGAAPQATPLGAKWELNGTVLSNPWSKIWID